MLRIYELFRFIFSGGIFQKKKNETKEIKIIEHECERKME